jgi:hypothetical protein
MSPRYQAARGLREVPRRMLPTTGAISSSGGPRGFWTVSRGRGTAFRMGWSKRDDGSLDGDAPADAVAGAASRIAEESRRRTRQLPSGEAILAGFVAALNLDGAREPFYSEPRRIDELVVRRAKREVRIDGKHADAWMVAEWYALFEEVAEQFDAEWDRAPHLRELLHFLASHVETDDAAKRLALDAGWQVRDADIVLTDRKKPRERKPAPEVPVLATGNLPRVRHPKFGEGVVVAEADDRLTVEFGKERRVLLRSFVVPVRE